MAETTLTINTNVTGVSEVERLEEQLKQLLDLYIEIEKEGKDTSEIMKRIDDVSYAKFWAETNKLRKSFQDGAMSAKQYADEIRKLKEDYAEFNRVAKDTGAIKGHTGTAAAISASLKEATTEANQAIKAEEAERIKAEREVKAEREKANKEQIAKAKEWSSKFKEYGVQAVKIITNSLKVGLKTSLNFMKGYTKIVFNGLVASFKGLGSLLKNSLSKVFSFGNGNGLFGNLTKLITLLGGLTVGKKLIDLSSDMYEFGRIADNVFGENAKEVEDWAKTVGSAYVDSTNAAQKYLSTIGTMFSNKGIDGNNLKEMSENVVKLTGDFANFYNLSKDDAFNKIQKALEGNVKALKDYGIDVSDAKVNAYLLAEGYKVQLSSLSEAEQQMIRYNYLLSENASIMGASANTATTWANQVDSLKGKLSEMGALLGNLLVKVLYPIIVALNTAADVSLKFLSALAPIFNFDSESMKGIFGGGGSTAVDNLEDEADAIDDVAKATKKANAQLQGFDKLNNMATSGDSSSKKGTGIGSLGMSLADYKDMKIPDVKLPEWLQKLLNVLKAKDWKGLGKLFAEGINYITTALRSKLTDPSTYENIGNLNTAIIQFLKGLLSADFSNVGGMIGDFVNLLTFTIKDFFIKGINEGVFADAGKDLADLIVGMVDEIDWTQAGEALAVGLRALLEGISSFLTTAKDNELGKKAGEAFREFIGGALEMLLGNGGDEKAGKAIADFINGALDFVVTLLTSENEEGKDLTEEITDHLSTIISEGIKNIDNEKLKKAASTLGSTLAKIMKSIATTLTENRDELSDSMSGAINGMVDDGTLSELAEGFSGLMFSIAGVLGETAKKVDWLGVVNSILTGIGDAMKSDEEGAATLGKALAAVFGLTAFGTAFSGALSLGGNIGTTALTSLIAKKIAGGSGSVALAAGEATTAIEGATTATSGLGAAASTTAAEFGLIGAVIAGIIASIVVTIQKSKAAKQGLKDLMDIKTTAITDEDSEKIHSFVTTSDVKTVEAYANALQDMNKRIQTISDDSDTNFFTDAVQQSVFNTNREITNLIGDLQSLQNETGMWTENMQQAYNTLVDAKGFTTAETKIAALREAQALLEKDFVEFKDVLAENDLEVAYSQSSEAVRLYDATTGEFVDTLDNYVQTTNEATLATETFNNTLDNSKEIQDDFANSMQNIADGYKNFDPKNAGTIIENMVSSAVDLAKTKADAKGVELSQETLIGVVNGIDADESVKLQLIDKVAEVAEETGIPAKDNGEDIAENLMTGMTEGLDSETLSDGLTTTIIDGVEASKETYTEQGKTLGEYITDGIVEGLNGNEGILKITSAIKALCDEMEKSFRDNLEIHSPSRLFTRLTEYVPEGAAQGIENKLPLIEDSMAKVRNSMIEGFDSDLLSKIRSNFNDLTFEATLEANKTATQSNSRLEEGLASLIRGSGNASGNQNITVQLVLDGNIMQKFVLDTVNENAVQNGGF